MAIILPANTLSAGGYDVANSCRFNDDDSPKLEKGMSAGNRDRWTFSCWVKRCNLKGVNGQTIFAAEVDGSNGTWILFDQDEKLRVGNLVSGSWQGLYKTNRVFRDVSAWYNIVVVWDSGNATAGERIRIYVNGTEETSFTTETNPSADQDTWANQTASTAYFRHGYNAGYSVYTDMYLAEVVFIDGTVYAASDFGEFDEDSPTIWKPKDVSGLTFGTNGYYLDFEDSANLGNDANGGTDFTETNLAAADSSTDTPTNNFCTINPLDNYYQAATFSEGNCKVVTGTTPYSYNTSTIGLSKGKWYYEQKVEETCSYDIAGIVPYPSQSTDHWVGYYTNSYGYRGDRGTIYTGNSEGGSYGATYTTSIIGVYIDLDNNKLYFSKDGTLQNSGTGNSITAAASTRDGVYFAGLGDYQNTSDTATYALNFGGCPAFTISSGNTDDNGYGNFEYSPNITGDGSAKSFYAICTKNLAEFG